MGAYLQLKTFARFARSEGLDDASLVKAIEDAARGLIDADLTGGLIKQHVARKGQGKRGGYRVLIAFRSDDFAVFLFGFAKSAQGNLDDRQLTTLRTLAAAWLSANAGTIQKFVEEGELVEVQK